METIDNSLDNNIENLDPLKGRWQFIAYSVIFACAFSFYYFWAYSYLISVATKIPGMSMQHNDYAVQQYVFTELASVYFHFVIAALFFFAAQVCSVIAVSMFFYRATNNLYKANLQNLTYTPGWAVGWFYIPFVQIVMPLLVANQMWKGSVAIKNKDNNSNWKNNGISPWILVWYISFIGSIVYMMVYSVILQTSMLQHMGNTHFGERMSDQEALNMISDVFGHFKVMFFGYCGIWVIQGLGLISWTRKVVQMQGN